MNHGLGSECPDLFFLRDHRDAPEVVAHLRRCELCQTLVGMTGAGATAGSTSFGANQTSWSTRQT